MATMIELDHVSKARRVSWVRPPVPVLTDVSFVAPPGSVTTLLGPNGAGKTTALRILLGLTPADDGTATIGGKPYRHHRQPLHHVGSTLSGLGAHPSRRVHHHLRWMAASHGIGRSRVDQLLAFVGLAAAARTAVGKLSFGMRQRLAIAAALIGNPPVLILDEPTTGLDPDGIEWLHSLIRMWASEGRTVLTTTHHIADTASSTDQVVIIDRGRVVAAKPTAQLSATHGDLTAAYFAHVDRDQDQP